MKSTITLCFGAVLLQRNGRKRIEWHVHISFFRRREKNWSRRCFPFIFIIGIIVISPGYLVNGQSFPPFHKRVTCHQFFFTILILYCVDLHFFLQYSFLLIFNDNFAWLLYTLLFPVKNKTMHSQGTLNIYKH